MDAEIKQALDDLKEDFHATMTELKNDMRAGFKEIKDANYLPKSDCEATKKDFRERFKALDVVVDGVRSTVTKAVGAVGIIGVLITIVIGILKFIK